MILKLLCVNLNSIYIYIYTVHKYEKILCCLFANYVHIYIHIYIYIHIEYDSDVLKPQVPNTCACLFHNHGCCRNVFNAVYHCFTVVATVVGYETNNLYVRPYDLIEF